MLLFVLLPLNISFMFVNLAPNEYIYLFNIPGSFLDMALENTLFFISGISAILIL
jgi:hypothetical protein